MIIVYYIIFRGALNWGEGGLIFRREFVLVTREGFCLEGFNFWGLDIQDFTVLFLKVLCKFGSRMNSDRVHSDDPPWIDICSVCLSVY